MFRSCKDGTFPTRVPVSTSVQREICLDRCAYCSDEFNSETETDIHTKFAHKAKLCKLLSDPTKFVCKTCFTEMPDEEELLKHIKSHHLLSSVACNQVEKEIFVCNRCQQIFFNKDWLAMHIVIIHKSQKRNTLISCVKCNRSIKKVSIWTHFVNHEMLSITCCPICCTKFKNRNEMVAHARNHQNKYICSTCGYYTHREVYFNQHVKKHEKLVIQSEIRTTDTSVSKYFIPDFRNSDMSWKYHRRSHGFKGYFLQDSYKICILCKQICLNMDQMTRHIMYDHRPDAQEQRKGYSCTCGENFSNKILLKHHVFKLKGNHKIIDETVRVEEPNRVFYYVIQDIETTKKSSHSKEQVIETNQTETFYIDNDKQDSNTTH